MSLKDRCAAVAKKSGRAIEIDAPELGAGEKAHVVQFTVGERKHFSELFDRLRVKLPDGRFATPIDEQFRQLLPLVAVEPDGTPSFTGADDPGVLMVPTRLAERLINQAVSQSSEATVEAKKPSPTTPTSPSSSTSPRTSG